MVKRSAEKGRSQPHKKQGSISILEVNILTKLFTLSIRLGNHGSFFPPCIVMSYIFAVL